MSRSSPEMIVFGLDGASWTFLEPWLEDGTLPRLRAIRDEHCSGPLESCLPPVTSPNWKCFSTGKQPGNLGVYWWETLDWTSGDLRTPRSTDFAGRELWDYLGKDGLRSLVVNMPTTFPPPSIEGVMISGGPATGERNFTRPRSLEERLREEHDYRAIPHNIDLIDHRPRQVIEEIMRLMKCRFRVAEELMEQQHFEYVQVTLFLINVLQHHFGHEEPVREAWQWIDRTIGRWRERFPDVPLVLLSDHGCNEISTKFNVNQWLIEQDYLRINQPRDQKWLHRMGINKDRIARLLARLGLKSTFKRLLPETVRNWLPTEDHAVRASGKTRLIRWDESRAYGFGQGPLFLNPSLPMQSNASLHERLSEQLGSLRTPADEPVAQQIVDGRACYGDGALGTPPDLVIDQAPGIHISGSIGFPQVFQSPEKWVAENARMGLYGWVEKSVEIEDPEPSEPRDSVRITDLMPSMCARLLGGVPEDVDGRPRIRRPDQPEPDVLPPLDREKEGEESTEDTRARLEHLGYLES